MTATQDDMIAELRRANAALRQELSERDAALAQRNSEYGERIAQQAATIDVLKAMSASPGDTQPVFDLIVTRARDLCDAYGATVYEFDGTLIHWRAATGVSDDPSIREALEAMYPMAPSREWPVGRAILDRQIIHISDVETEPGLNPAMRGITAKTSLVVPLMRGGVVIGGLALGSRERGRFSDSQIELLKTLAEQAVIAITSAETYRALQARTADLRESLEYQTATSGVLKAISRAAYDLDTVLNMLIITAVRLCEANHGQIWRKDGEVFRYATSYMNVPAYRDIEERTEIKIGRGTLIGRVGLERRPVLIADAWNDPEYKDQEGARLAEARSMLGVPLLRDGELIGAFALARRIAVPFADRQVELVRTFADQAVIAIENTRLLTEQREALEQQTASAEVLQVINASAGDLERVFDTILEKAILLCESAFGSLVTYDGESFQVVATRGMSTGLAKALRERGPLQPSKSFAYDQIVRGADIVHIPDITALGKPFPSSPNIDQDGARTTLFVAVRGDDALLGVFVIYRKEVRLFSDKQIALLKNFAAQAVIAMENARLITEQQEALEQQTATAEVLQVINASPGNLTPVFDAILEKAHSLCGATKGAFITSNGEHFPVAATRGLSDAYTAVLRNYSDRPAKAGYVVDELSPREQLLNGADLVQLTGPAVADGPIGRAAVEIEKIQTVLFVPLRRDGALLGYITAYREEESLFSEKQIAVLQNFASQAVIAMDNARLITEQREALEQQTATADVLRVINNFPGRLTPVFETILEKAHSVCEATMGSLALFDGDVLRSVVERGMSAVSVAALRQPRIPRSGGPAERFRSGERFVQFPDLRVAQDSLSQTIATNDGIRTVLFVPLRRDATLLGWITAYRTEPKPFTPKQMSLLESFAAQAVIAMENARLLTETREALEQQTATAEVLQVINASPGNIAPVFDAVLEKAIRLCDSAFGMLATYDGHIMHYVAMRGLTPEQEALLADRPLAAGQPTGRIGDGEDVVHLMDAGDQDGYRAGFGPTRNFVDQVGARTAMWVALRKDKELLGILTIFRREVRAFTDREIALVQNFAAQAVIAMENARLLGELRKRTGDLEESLEYQTATSDVLKAISRAAYDLDTVLTMLIAAAARLCGATHGQIWRRDGEVFRHAASHMNVPAYQEMEKKTEIRAGRGTLIGRVVMERRPVHIADAWNDPEYEDKEAARLGQGRSMLGVPLLRDGELIGAFALARRVPMPFTDRQVEVVSTFADQTVIAIENTRLITEQSEALEQQTATAEVLQVINASPGNLTPVFNTMLEKAMRLCEAAFGLLFTHDGKRYHTAAQRGVPAALAEYRATNPPTAQPGSRSAMLLTITSPHHVLDITVDDYYLSGGVDDRSIADLGGARTVLYVPLRKDETTLGIIAIYRQEVRAFSDKQIALVENFAAQAVIAMESARLLNELRARTDELAQRQAELRVTFENMGDGVAMFDETQHLVAWNRKFQDILDVPDEAMTAQRTFPEYVRYLAERGEYGAGADPEEQIRRLTGQASQYRAYERTRPNGRVIEIRHNPVAGGGFVLIYADITERKRNEAEIRAARDAAEAAYRELKTAQANLIQAEKMASLGQLTAGIAHEIKNPLNFVNNFAALSVDLLSELKETAAPGFAVLSEERRAEVEDISAMLTSNLEKITEHGKRADGIVKAMLEHSRGSSGERRMVDLNALIDEALNLAYHGARAQDQTFNITLERNLGEGMAPIEVNPQDMTRVFLNIFSNGFYAANKRARNSAEVGFAPALKVTTRDAGEVVEIRVRDNGIGIPADISDQLFQPFFTTKPTGEGTGLGLSITYDIVTKAHGGTITVDSEVDEFTEFVVTLPRGMFANERIKP